MLAEHQVVHLLEEVERYFGRRLEGIRGHLRSEAQSRSAIWELIVMDAARESGRLEYERRTGRGLTPDIYVETAHGAFWIEAAFLLPRFGAVEARREAFRQAVRREVRRLGLPPGSISDDFYGEKAPYGFAMKLPAIHELPSFLASCPVAGFFSAALTQPDQPMMIDLGEFGATVRLVYAPHRQSYSTSIVLEQPRVVTEHAVYRLLEKKAKKYSARDLASPFLVCIGSERSTAVRSLSNPLTISTRAAVWEACRKYPVIAAVLVVSIEDVLPLPGDLNNSRQARVQAFVNHSATLPVSKPLLDSMTLAFNRIDYGHSWKEWENEPSAEGRMAKKGGGLTVKEYGDGFSVDLPATDVARVLAGTLTAEEWHASYGFSDERNPLKRAVAEARPIVEVQLLPHDPRGSEPQRMRVKFGRPTPLLLQTPKPK